MIVGIVVGVGGAIIIAIAGYAWYRRSMKSVLPLTAESEAEKSSRKVAPSARDQLAVGGQHSAEL